ncbi:MAG: hypothetical protein SVK08_00980 [Halobacteriota archaeon]|nr:hypothetical protein [Halobacteriota archaeon]
MSDVFDDFLNAMSGLSKKSESKKSELNFKVFKGTDLSLASHVPFGVPSRIPQLDLSLGRPGYPAGRIVELYGYEASGKTTSALAAIAAAQRKGGFCLWIDAEFAWSPEWAITNGVDPDRVMVAEADTIESILNIQSKALDAHEKINDSNTPFVMVVDSITAVPSEESIDKGFGEVQKIGTDARAIRNGMRKLTKEIAEHNALALYINHSTAKTNAMAFGKQSQSAGGHALKFYSSLRIEFTAGGNIYGEGTGMDRVREGMKVFIQVEKNKVMKTGRPKIECHLLNNGFNLYENLFDALLDIQEIERINTQTYLFKETQTQMRRSEWKSFVDNHSEGIDKLYEWFLKKAIEKEYIKAYR